MNYKELITNTYNELKTNLKNLDIYLTSKYNDDEYILAWEWISDNFKKDNMSEFDLFKKYQKEINFADKKLLEIAKFCESNNLTYSLKICKIDKLQKDTKDPALLTSYISVGFPTSQYYESQTNDNIPDTLEEFEKRKERNLFQ